MTADARVTEVGRSILERIVAPKDHWEIAAQLEVMGIRDEDARSDFACKDTFELARQIHTMFRAGSLRLETQPVQERQTQRAPGFLRDYFSGLVFSLPMAVQAAFMLMRGYGLWGARAFDARTSTAMAIGVVASYAVTGGFSQTIVRRGLFYIYQEEDYLARAVALRLWTISVLTAIALLIPFFLFNVLYSFLPWDMVSIVILYYAGLSVLWLNFAIIYLLRKPHLFAIVTCAGLAVAFVLIEIFKVPILAAHAVALIATDVLSFGWSMAILTRRIRRKKSHGIANAPRLTILVYSTALFFAYGALYSLFLFTDRLMAWTSAAGRGDYLPYPIWVDGPYELGMDLALIIVVLLMGIIEHATQRFSWRLIPSQEQLPNTASDEFNRDAVEFHTTQMIIFGVAAVAAIIIAFVALFFIGRYGHVTALQTAATAATVRRVFVIGAFGYAFLMAALLNTLLLLSLSRVNLVLVAIVPAWATNLIVAFICGRVFHYSFAALGLLAGSIVFFVVSAVVTHRVMRNLDYFYYSAY